MTSLSRSPLRRFVTDGLRETIDSYTAGALPLHRFAWELDARLSTLSELTGLPQWRTLAALRAAQRAIAEVDTALRDTGREGLTRADEHTLGSAVTTLRAMLAQLDPDPVDPGELADPPSVVIAFPARPAAGEGGSQPLTA